MNKKMLTKGLVVLTSAIALSVVSPAHFATIPVKATALTLEQQQLLIKLNGIEASVVENVASELKAANKMTFSEKATDKIGATLQYMVGTSKTDSSPVKDWENITATEGNDSYNGSTGATLAIKDNYIGKKIFFRKSDEATVISDGIDLVQGPAINPTDYTLSADQKKITVNENGLEYKVGSADWKSDKNATDVFETGIENGSVTIYLRRKAADKTLASPIESLNLVSETDSNLRAEYSKATFSAKPDEASEEDAAGKLTVDFSHMKDQERSGIKYLIKSSRAEAVETADGSWTESNLSNSNKTVDIVVKDKVGEYIFFKKSGANQENTVSDGIKIVQHSPVTRDDYVVSDDNATITFRSEGWEYRVEGSGNWMLAKAGKSISTGAGEQEATFSIRKQASEMKIASEKEDVKFAPTRIPNFTGADYRAAGGYGISITGLDHINVATKNLLMYSIEGDVEARYKKLFPNGADAYTRVSDVVIPDVSKATDNKLWLKVVYPAGPENNPTAATVKTESGIAITAPSAAPNISIRKDDRTNKYYITGLNASKFYEYQWNDNDFWVSVPKPKSDATEFDIFFNGKYKVREKSGTGKTLASQIKEVTVTELSEATEYIPTNPAVKKEDPKKEDPKKEEPKKDDTKTEAPKTEEPKTEAPAKETPVDKTVSSKKAAATVSAEDVALVTGKLTVKVKDATVVLPKAVLSDGAVKVSLKAMAPKKDSKDAKTLTKNLKKNKLEDKNVYSLSVKSGKKNVKGKFRVELKTTLKKAPKKLYVMNVANGKLMKAKFKKGMVTFTAGMTGKFVVVSK